MCAARFRQNVLDARTVNSRYGWNHSSCYLEKFFSRTNFLPQRTQGSQRVEFCLCVLCVLCGDHLWLRRSRAGMGQVHSFRRKARPHPGLPAGGLGRVFVIFFPPSPAPEVRKLVAHGVSRGSRAQTQQAPAGAKELDRFLIRDRSVAPVGAELSNDPIPRLTPWATFGRCSAA